MFRVIPSLVVSFLGRKHDVWPQAFPLADVKGSGIHSTPWQRDRYHMEFCYANNYDSYKCQNVEVFFKSSALKINIVQQFYGFSAPTVAHSPCFEKLRRIYCMICKWRITAVYFLSKYITKLNMSECKKVNPCTSWKAMCVQNMCLLVSKVENIGNICPVAFIFQDTHHSQTVQATKW
jgi:hypothetical protein